MQSTTHDLSTLIPRQTTLIVSATRGSREYLRAVLENSGRHTILEAVEIGPALRILRETHVDHVVLDGPRKPDDREELIRRLRAGSRAPNLPVIVLAPKSHIRGLENSYSADPTWFVFKPFAPSRLIDSYRQVLRLRRRKGNAA